jgi:hypothetical protein
MLTSREIKTIKKIEAKYNPYRQQRVSVNFFSLSKWVPQIFFNVERLLTEKKVGKH